MNTTTFETQGAKLTVTRSFDARLEPVWRAWAEAELLDQWWAPKPWQSKTKWMDFKEGGSRLYAMCGPEGEEHWGLTSYSSISNLKKFSGEDAFCDNEGTVNPEFPVATFENSFSEAGNKTTVVIVTEYASEQHLNQVIEMGMKEGLSAAFETLEEVLKNNG